MSFVDGTVLEEMLKKLKALFESKADKTEVPTITPTLTTGTKVADITVGSTTSELYAPSGGEPIYYQWETLPGKPFSYLGGDFRVDEDYFLYINSCDWSKISGYVPISWDTETGNSSWHTYNLNEQGEVEDYQTIHFWHLSTRPSWVCRVGGVETRDTFALTGDLSAYLPSATYNAQHSLSANSVTIRNDSTPTNNGCYLQGYVNSDNRASMRFVKYGDDGSVANSLAFLLRTVSGQEPSIVVNGQNGSQTIAKTLATTDDIHSSIDSNGYLKTTVDNQSFYGVISTSNGDVSFDYRSTGTEGTNNRVGLTFNGTSFSLFGRKNSTSNTTVTVATKDDIGGGTFKSYSVSVGTVASGSYKDVDVSSVCESTDYPMSQIVIASNRVNANATLTTVYMHDTKTIRLYNKGTANQGYVYLRVLVFKP